MELSRFGKKFTSRSGILELMDDLGVAMNQNQGQSTSLIMMGGGNPAHIPEVEAVWRGRMQEILSDGKSFDAVTGNYDTPRGNVDFLKTLASFFKKQFGWNVTEKNITLTNGSQSAFFFLFNLFAGDMPDGSFKKILIPMVPEYIGYADQGISENLFTSCRPVIEKTGTHSFKYHVDFDHLKADKNTGAICVSRPSNPTGNVLTEIEIEKLSGIAQSYKIPFFIDCAYGSPFPDIQYKGGMVEWNETRVLSYSLSKIGLPGTRTGIVVANEEIINALSSVNAIISLANGNLGQAITGPLFENGEILNISKDMVLPHYKKKSLETIGFLHTVLGNFDYFIHESEGAFFLWLHFPGLPITAHELYNRLKARGVLIVPGHYFFPGDLKEWKHKDECIRITFSQNEEDVKKGILILAEELKKLK